MHDIGRKSAPYIQNKKKVIIKICGNNEASINQRRKLKYVTV
jgi:hypothetical protein